jgi:glutathione S-transferase
MSGEVEYKFYVKASPDGKSLGDCPFTQRANLALKIKNVRATYILIDLAHKPKWYFSVNPAGTAPALDVGARVIGDSYDILCHLDQAHPAPSLDLPGNSEAEEVTGKVFSVFAAWAKNKEAGKGAELREKFIKELEKIDQFLAKGPGPLLCGEGWSRADCALVPRLYHISSVASHYLDYHLAPQFPSLARYMDTTFASQAFRDTDYPRDWVLASWAKYFS